MVPDDPEKVSGRHAKINTLYLGVLTHVTNEEINFLSKGHNTYGLKISFTSNLKNPACASN